MKKKHTTQEGITESLVGVSKNRPMSSASSTSLDETQGTITMYKS